MTPIVTKAAQYPTLSRMPALYGLSLLMVILAVSSALGQGSPGIYSPVNNATLTGTAVTFQWSGFPGATAYWLDVGKEQGGNEYYQSGSLPVSTLSQTVNTLPSDGSTVWARWYYLLSGTWQYTDYSYTAFGGSADRGVITSPAPGSTLSGSSVIFNWTAGMGATAYWLDAGNVAGGNQYLQSGNLGNVLTTTVSGLPTNGSVIYVTLYSLVSGQWLSNQYTYTAFNVAAAEGVLTTPTPGSTLTSGTVTFNWTAGTGATAYWLDAGNVAGGNQYHQSGNLGNVLTTTVSGLPTNGSTIYVTLYSLISGQWLGNSYTYTALNADNGLAAMQMPTPGSTLTGNSATFTWSADANATAYWLDIGTSPGGNTIYQSGNLGNVLTTTVDSLPANGSTIFATLYSYVGGQWLHNSYTYVSGGSGAGGNCGSCTFVQATESGGTNERSDPTTYVTPTTKGNMLYVFWVHSNWSGSGTTTVADTAGNTWHPCSGIGNMPAAKFTDIQDNSTYGIGCAYALNINGGADTATVTSTDCASTCTYVAAVYAEFSGPTAWDAYGSQANAISSAGNNNTTCGSATTTQANDLIICSQASANGTYTAGTSPITFALEHNGYVGVLEDAIWSSSGLINPAMTLSVGSTPYGGVTLALK